VVALTDAVFAVFFVIGEPLPNFSRIVLQAGDALGFFALEALLGNFRP